jgi:hypothetical protein
VAERFGLHFEQRDVDVLLQIDVRRLGGVQSSEHFSFVPAILADVAELRLEVVQQEVAVRILRARLPSPYSLTRVVRSWIAFYPLQGNQFVIPYTMRKSCAMNQAEPLENLRRMSGQNSFNTIERVS